MKNILCFGDSNTYGYDPRNAGRYPYNVRWTGILQNILGRDNYYVIEEGLNSRTTVLSDPLYDDEKSGLAMLPAIIKSHMPLDLCIIMLGTNDLKYRFSAGAYDIGAGVELLAKTVKRVSAQSSFTVLPCKILLIAPIPVTDAVLTGTCSGDFSKGCIETSRQLSKYIRNAAINTDSAFLDGYSIVTPSEIDGLHLSSEGHKIFAQAVYDKVRELIG